MRWLVGIVLLFVLGCQSANSLSGNTVGSGPVKLSASAYGVWEQYLARDPIVFAITPDGRNAYYYYCTEVGCQPPRLVSYVLQRCQERYGTPCLLFAMEDQVVWENPGEWRPSETELSDAIDAFVADADPETHVPLIEEQISEVSYIKRYRNGPQHKALALVFDGETGRVVTWGTGYAYSSREAAIRGAFKRCVREAPSRYQFCRMFEVDGENVWPQHKDDLVGPE